MRSAVGVVSERIRRLPSDDSPSARDSAADRPLEPPSQTRTFCLSEVNDNSLDSGVATTSIAVLDAP